MEILQLFVPLIIIGFGIILKSTNREDFKPQKKYWLFFIIAGVFLFAFRLYDFLK
ncbi:hypothetical protein ACHRVK_17865 [Flavobacterium plurextorum]|uniref:hypothetical protein n=1 Tax=Flavobacterium plurextorum TaxID=1114867 RepID=UPI00375702AB